MNKQNSKFEIDEIKLTRMRNKIYFLETLNMKNKKHSTREMIEEIHKIMNEELNKTL